MAIDHGGRRIGIAISDPLGITVRPLTTIDRRKDRDPVGTVVDLVAIHGPERLVIGIPIETSGEFGEAAERVRRFKERLVLRLEERGFARPIDEIDESYTTTEANSRLKDRGVNAEDRKMVIDQEAAAVMLESYLREGGLR